MSVADEAKVAALEAYPQGITAEGIAEWRRTPFAHGYQRGYAAGAEEAFRAAWEASGEGHNGEWPDEGRSWEESEGRKEFLAWRERRS
ncbi:hypothetical protein SEA_PHINKY_72 [Microbacterium phage Phinky]|nr:hypothetical protein SEA_PHINKY_72 [Microbacterium phage Phinky]